MLQTSADDNFTDGTQSTSYFSMDRLTFEASNGENERTCVVKMISNTATATMKVLLTSIFCVLFFFTFENIFYLKELF